MRNPGILIAAILIAGTPVASGQDTTKIGVGKKNLVTVNENFERTEVRIGADDNIVVEDNDDTVKIKLGKKGISIVEKNGETSIDIIDIEDFEEHGWKKKKRERFKGHWAGFEIGLNNYVNNDFSMSLAPANNFMDLNTGRSWNVNINFMQYNLPMGSRAGWVTGLGLRFNDYHFDGDNNITKDIDGNIMAYVPGYPLNKSKLSVEYLTVPLLLEFQFGPQNKLFISGGLIGSLKIGSHSKIVYKGDGHKERDKTKDDFNLNALQYGVSLRMGFKSLKIFANYSLMPLFEKYKGPELYPFSVGLTLLSFR